MEDRIIGGKYRFIMLLGKGGSGSVYLAEDICLRKLWAVKHLKEEKNQTGYSELETLRHVKHENLPLIVDAVLEQGDLYLVMEYIEGENLQEILECKKSLPIKESIAYAIQILHAIAHLHGMNPPVIYGDLKPSNIMVDQNGKITLIDFGGVLKGGQRKITTSQKLFGTPGYAAPEQIGRADRYRGIDARADIYSFGIILYEMITGERPMGRGGIKKMKNPFIPERLKKIIRKCIRLNVEERYESSMLLLKDLEMYQETERKRNRQHKYKLVLFFVQFMICVGSFVYAYMGNRNLFPVALIFWVLSFLWYRNICVHKQEFFQGDVRRVLATDKTVPGLFAIVICAVLLGSALREQIDKYVGRNNITVSQQMFSVDNVIRGTESEGWMPEDDSGADEKEFRDDYGRKILVKEN